MDSSELLTVLLLLVSWQIKKTYIKDVQAIDRLPLDIKIFSFLARDFQQSVGIMNL